MAPPRITIPRAWTKGRGSKRAAHTLYPSSRSCSWCVSLLRFLGTEETESTPFSHLQKDPWYTRDLSRHRYRDLCASFGTSQTFQPQDIPRLRTSVLHACRRYITIRYEHERARAAQLSVDRARALSDVELAKDGIAWLVDLFGLYLPVKLAFAIQQAQEPGRVTPQLAEAHPLLGTIFKVQQCVEREGHPRNLALSAAFTGTSSEFRLTDEELSFISLPLSARLPVASQGYEESKRKADLMRVTRAGMRTDEASRKVEDQHVDLINWEMVAKDTHPFLSAEACRSKWLMLERPDLTAMILGILPPACSFAEPQFNDAEREQYHRRWRWIGPNSEEITEQESAQLTAVVLQMSAEPGGFAGRWEEAKRRMKTNHQGFQLLQHWQRRAHAIPPTGAAKWALEEEAAVVDLVSKYGNRHALFSELLDWPHRSSQAIGRYYAENLDPAIARSADKKRKRAQKKSEWTAEEDETLASLMHEHDGRPSWLLIRKQLPGRTNNQCKERWQKQERLKGKSKQQETQNSTSQEQAQ